MRVYDGYPTKVVTARDGHQILLIYPESLTLDLDKIPCPDGMRITEILGGAAYGEVSGRESMEYSVRCVQVHEGHNLWPKMPDRSEIPCPDGFTLHRAEEHYSSFGEPVAYHPKLVFEYGVQCVK
jgi:hypothetical protein